MRRLLGIVFACVAVALSPPAQGQSAWPTRPIRLLIPTGAGAATDIMARLLANGVGGGLGQPVVVENMPGASGLLAHQTAARAPADGYTLLFTNTSGMSINPVSFKTLPYDPVRDFTAVAMFPGLSLFSASLNAAACPSRHRIDGVRHGALRCPPRRQA